MIKALMTDISLKEDVREHMTKYNKLFDDFKGVHHAYHMFCLKMLQKGTKQHGMK